MKTAEIEITDHDTGSPMICTMYYIVEYRPTGTNGWDSITPNPIEPPIVIPNLIDDIHYDIRITRYCCGGSKSAAATSTFLTTI